MRMQETVLCVIANEINTWDICGSLRRAIVGRRLLCPVRLCADSARGAISFLFIFSLQRKETARCALTRQPQPLQIKYNCNEQDVPVTITRCKRSTTAIIFFFPSFRFYFFFSRRYLFFYHFPWSIQPFHLVPSHKQNRDRQQQKDTNEAQTALRMFHYNNDERKKKKIKRKPKHISKRVLGSRFIFSSRGDEWWSKKKRKAFEAT